VIKSDDALAPWIKRFLLEHLVGERNLAHNTQRSYRDTLRLLLPSAAKTAGKAIDRLGVTDLSADLVRNFLTELESERGCSIATRNQRLAAIHALARFIGERNPEALVWCGEVRGIPFKRTGKISLSYLEKTEMDALLNAPDERTGYGRRDRALLLFLYNTGARASEVAATRIADLTGDSSRGGMAELRGKGSKIRRVPLWGKTFTALIPLIQSRTAIEPVFLNRYGEPITRFGIYELVERHAVAAGKQAPSITAKRVSPHTIRHTTATHLLRAGVDINTIRSWLGHVSIDTTNVYAEVDLEMKAKALAACEPEAASTTKRWRTEPAVMDFLRSL
jgi:integrase/recombinase XerD